MATYNTSKYIPVVLWILSVDIYVNIYYNVIKTFIKNPHAVRTHMRAEQPEHTPMHQGQSDYI